MTKCKCKSEDVWSSGESLGQHRPVSSASLWLRGKLGRQPWNGHTHTGRQCHSAQKPRPVAEGEIEGDIERGKGNCSVTQCIEGGREGAQLKSRGEEVTFSTRSAEQGLH